MDMKFLDVVKWMKPMNKAEENDIMVVEDILNEHLIEVRHISTQKSTLSNEQADDLRVVGSCTPYENIEEILKRYKNS